MHRPELIRILGYIGVIAAAALMIMLLDTPSTPPAHTDSVTHSADIPALFAERRSGVWVDVTGHVTRILADDREGSAHQRFIITVNGGHTLLIAHNIDVAPRVPVAPNDRISARGRYEWTPRGGVLHWTHHDPDGDSAGGWIEHKGQRYF